MKERPVTELTTLTDVECCDSRATFVLDNGQDHIAVSLEMVLLCLKLAQERGHVPDPGAQWWCQVASETSFTYLL